MVHHFTKKSVIELYPLLIEKEDHKYIVGREDTEIYVLVQKIGVLIIKLLKKYKTIENVEKNLPKEYKEYDVSSFVRRLIAYDFVKKIDEHETRHHYKPVIPLISPKKKAYVSWLFSAPMYFIYALIIFFGIYIICKDTWYLPRYEDFFFHPSYSVILIVGFIVGWIFVGMHEFMHLFAALSRGIGSTISLSTRFYFLVAVTDFTNVYELKPIKRMRIFFAGMVFDLILGFISIILMWLSDNGILSLNLYVYKFLQFIVLMQFISVLWQFLFYMKTDLYYVYETLASCYNINEKAAVLLGHWFRGLRIFPQRFLHSYESYFFEKRERTKVIIYSLFYIFGIALITVTIFTFFIPITLELFKGLIINLYQGIINNDFKLYIDALVFLGIYLIQQGVFVYQFVKHHKLYLRTWFYWVMLFFVLMSYFFVSFFVTLEIISQQLTPVLTVLILAAIGGVFGFFELDLIRHMNKHTIHKKINPELLLFLAILVFSAAMAKILEKMSIELGLFMAYSPYVVGLFFALGMVISHIIFNLIRK